MRKLLLGAATVLAMGFAGVAALADGHGKSWALDGAASTVAFGSIKKDTVGETHHFAGLSGTVTQDGEVSVEIDLASVETWIDKRNERMIEHVFMNAPTATFSAKVDMASLEGLAVGGMQDVGLKGTLTMGSAEIPVQADMIAVRLNEMRVMIVTAEMIWVSTEEAGIDAGVTKLLELAKLPSITRAFPVTLRLVFDHRM